MAKLDRMTKLLSVDEVAEILGLKPSTIRAWLLRRKLPFVRVGLRAVRVPIEAVEELIAQGTVPAREDRRERQ